MAKAKAAKATEAEAVVLPAIIEDDELVSTSAVVLTFLRGLTAFFRTAKDLEAKAVETLEAAKMLRLPENGNQDEMVKRFARICADNQKAAEAHWSITAKVSAFHKRLTAARARAVNPNVEAREIAMGIHNTWTEQERRRAAEEQQRQRLEAERVERERREIEMLAAEAEAMAREAASPSLSPREITFATAHMMGANPVTAAQRAGYKDPTKSAALLLASAKIQAYIKQQREAAMIREQARQRAAEPVSIVEPDVRPDINTEGDRTTKSAVLFDEAAFIRAILEGKHGIPSDVLTVRPAVLNSYARALGKEINNWPGVRLQTKTVVV